MEGDTGVCGGLIPEEWSRKSQPARKTEENHMSCLCREKCLICGMYRCRDKGPLRPKERASDPGQ